MKKLSGNKVIIIRNTAQLSKILYYISYLFSQLLS